MVTYYRYRDVLVGTLSMISVERCLPLFIRPFDEFSGIELVFLPLIRYRWKLGIGFDHRFLPFFEFLHLSGYPKIIFVPRDFFFRERRSSSYFIEEQETSKKKV